MNIIENYKSIMTDKYSMFYGRATRSEFWYFILVNILILLFLFIPINLLPSEHAFIAEVILVLYLLGVFIPGMAVSTRRLHDTGRSGWWLLLYLIPYIGVLALFFMFISEGDLFPNSYGNPQRIDDIIRRMGSEESHNFYNSKSKAEDVTAPSLDTSQLEIESKSPDVIEEVRPEVKSPSLPEGIKSIGKSMFSNNKDLTEIEIPASVIEIEDCAFYGCNKLKKIIFLGNEVKRIGNEVFQNCESLSAIVIPEGVEELGDWVFNGCSSLTSALFPNSVKKIGVSTFYNCCNLEEVLLPSNLKDISEDMFNGCSSLKTIQIPQTVTYIGNNAFVNCTSLDNIDIPDSVTELGFAVFHGCENLKEIKLSKNIRSLSNSLFACCSSLSYINIPSSVTEFGSCIFLRCSSLKTFTIPVQIKTIKSNPFQMMNLRELVCESPEFKVIGNALYDKDVARIISCFRAEKDFKLPDSVTCVGDYAFAYNWLLEKVECPTDIKKIGDHAFYMCNSLKEININPADVTIGREAFAGCYNLKIKGIETGYEPTEDDVDWAIMELESYNDIYHDLDF